MRDICSKAGGKYSFTVRTGVLTIENEFSGPATFPLNNDFSI